MGADDESSGINRPGLLGGLDLLLGTCLLIVSCVVLASLLLLFLAIVDKGLSRLLL